MTETDITAKYLADLYEVHLSSIYKTLKGDGDLRLLESIRQELRDVKRRVVRKSIPQCNPSTGLPYGYHVTLAGGKTVWRIKKQIIGEPLDDA